MKRRIWLALCGPLIALGATGCSNQAVAEWVAWWQEDPTAAEQFAQQPEIQQDWPTETPEAHQAHPGAAAVVELYGTGSLNVRVAATGTSPPATAISEGCSSPLAHGERQVDPGCRIRPVVRSRSG